MYMCIIYVHIRAVPIKATRSHGFLRAGVTGNWKLLYMGPGNFTQISYKINEFLNHRAFFPASMSLFALLWSCSYLLPSQAMYLLHLSVC